MRVTARTRRLGACFELDLRITSMSLRRRLAADACETLGEAAALLIAIAIAIAIAIDPLEVAAQVASVPTPVDSTIHECVRYTL